MKSKTNTTQTNFPPTWKDLYQFIQEKIAEEGESFLENEIMIECQDPNHINSSFKTRVDSEGWVYSQPAWCLKDYQNPEKGKHINSTTFKKEKIVTLNINY